MQLEYCASPQNLCSDDGDSTPHLILASDHMIPCDFSENENIEVKTINQQTSKPFSMTTSVKRYLSNGPSPPIDSKDKAMFDITPPIRSSNPSLSQTPLSLKKDALGVSKVNHSSLSNVYYSMKPGAA